MNKIHTYKAKNSTISSISRSIDMIYMIINNIDMYSSTKRVTVELFTSLRKIVWVNGFKCERNMLPQ